MPMSMAAMDGIRDNGHRWQHTLRGMKPHTELLGKINDGDTEITMAQGEAAVEAIVHRVRSFAQAVGNERIRDDLDRRADELEMVADCDIEDINFAMEELYDACDYWRILVL